MKTFFENVVRQNAIERPINKIKNAIEIDLAITKLIKIVNIDNIVNIDTTFLMCLQRQIKPITSKNPKFPKISNFPLCSTNNSGANLHKIVIDKIIVATTKVSVLPDCLSSNEFILFYLFLFISYNKPELSICEVRSMAQVHC